MSHADLAAARETMLREVHATLDVGDDAHSELRRACSELDEALRAAIRDDDDAADAAKARGLEGVDALHASARRHAATAQSAIETWFLDHDERLREAEMALYEGVLVQAARTAQRIADLRAAARREFADFLRDSDTHLDDDVTAEAAAAQAAASGRAASGLPQDQTRPSCKP